MSYISTQKVAEIRANLKKEFPEIKFSVRKSSGAHSIEVSIMKAPYEFRPIGKETKGYSSMNDYWFKEHGWRHVNILERIVEICNDGNWNNSNAQIDYFDVGWYVSLHIGKWNQEFQLTPMSTNKTVRTTSFAGVPQCL